MATIRKDKMKKGKKVEFYAVMPYWYAVRGHVEDKHICAYGVDAEDGRNTHDELYYDYKLKKGEELRMGDCTCVIVLLCFKDDKEMFALGKY